MNSIDIKEWELEITQNCNLACPLCARTDQKYPLWNNPQISLHDFKELFTLDGKSSSFSEEDKGRRNTIANLLEEWDLVKIVEPEKTQGNIAPLAQIKILPYKEKSEWELVAKYNIGGKR